MATIFSRIVQGEIPSFKIAETEDFYAFLDINPVQKGHTLVIPKREKDYFFDLNDDELAGIMAFSKKVAKAIQEAFPCPKVGISVVGLEVNHAHIHLIPLHSVGDMDFSKKSSPSMEELEAVAEAIKLRINND